MQSAESIPSSLYVNRFPAEGEMILALLIWVATLFLPGYFLSNLLKKGETFADKIAYSLMLSSAFLVAVFASRLLISFPVIDAGWLIAFVTCALCGENLRNHRLSFPRPKKTELGVLAFTISQAVIVILHLTKYPLFPPLLTISPDFLNTAHLIQDYSNGLIPALGTQLLYYGVHFHLSLLIFLFGPGANVILLERIGMGILSIFSTFYLFAAVKTLSKSEAKAFATVLIYSLTGFLWFGEIYNSGLYPNFYGLLASLFLIVACKDFLVKKVGVRSLIFLLFALLNASFSHYSTLLLFPVIIFIVLVKSAQGKAIKRGLLITMILLLPLVIGVLLFFNTLLSFATSSTGFSPNLDASWLAQIFGIIPSLAYSILFMTNDPGTMIMLFILVPVYIFFTIKSRDAWMALPGLFFAFTIFISPLNSSAWRFSFVALLPFTIMVGCGLESANSFVLSKISAERKKLNKPFKGRLSKVSGICLMFLIMPMLFNSWGMNSFINSVDNIEANSKHDYAVYDAMRWMSNHTGNYITPNDGKFSLAKVFVGRNVTFEPNLMGVPQSLYFYQIQHKIKYVIISNILGPYGKCTQYDINLIPLNSTQGHAVRLNLKIFPPVNASGTVVVNETSKFNIYIKNGDVNGTLDFQKPGTYQVKIIAGTLPSNTLTLFMGSIKQPLTTPINPYACYPPFWQAKDMGNPTLVYSNSDIRIYCQQSAGDCPK